MAGLATHSHFHIGIRVAVGIHGSQVCTAHNADQQALLLRAVLEGDEDAAPLLQGLVFRLVHLWGRQSLGCAPLLPSLPSATGHQGHPWAQDKWSRCFPELLRVQGWPPLGKHGRQSFDTFPRPGRAGRLMKAVQACAHLWDQTSALGCTVWLPHCSQPDASPFLILLRSPVPTFWLLLTWTPLLHPLSTQTHPAGAPGLPRVPLPGSSPTESQPCPFTHNCTLPITKGMPHMGPRRQGPRLHLLGDGVPVK